ncbi:hypothetical protein V8C86DRAFT_3137901 [Haematococcus lacustris]
MLAGGSAALLLAKVGDRLVYTRLPWTEAASPDWCEVLYEDNDMLLLAKPAGLQVLPAARQYQRTVLSILQAHYTRLPAALALREGSAAALLSTSCPTPVHRLGRGTSGLLLCAKTSRSRSVLSAAFTHATRGDPAARADPPWPCTAAVQQPAGMRTAGKTAAEEQAAPEKQALGFGVSERAMGKQQVAGQQVGTAAAIPAPGSLRKLYRTLVQGWVAEGEGHCWQPIGRVQHPGVARGLWAACSPTPAPASLDHGPAPEAAGAGGESAVAGAGSRTGPGAAGSQAGPEARTTLPPCTRGLQAAGSEAAEPAAPATPPPCTIPASPPPLDPDAAAPGLAAAAAAAEPPPPPAAAGGKPAGGARGQGGPDDLQGGLGADQATSVVRSAHSFWRVLARYGHARPAGPDVSRLGCGGSRAAHQGLDCRQGPDPSAPGPAAPGCEEGPGPGPRPPAPVTSSQAPGPPEPGPAPGADPGAPRTDPKAPGPPGPAPGFAQETDGDSYSHCRPCECPPCPRGSPSSSLVEVEIFTGRPHQIRIHMAALGHPLVGDPLYVAGGRPAVKDSPAVVGVESEDAWLDDETASACGLSLPGQCGYLLHSHQLWLHHPSGDGRVLHFTAPLPLELRLPHETQGPTVEVVLPRSELPVEQVEQLGTVTS